MEFTEEKIKQYKQQYGSIFKYTANDGKSCLLHAPDLITLDACRSIAGKSSIRFDIALVENCWIDGDAELKSVDKYQMGLFDTLGGIIQKIEGELLEL